MKNKTNYKVVISIVLSSLFLGIIYNYFSADGIPFIRKELIVNFVSLDRLDSTSTELKGLQLGQVFKLYEQNNAIFIDARDQWEFSESHIKGALNIPEFSFTVNDSNIHKVDKESLLVIYCDGDDCDISKRLTNELMKIGYKNSYVFLGGLKEWADAELPIEKGEAHE